MRSSEDLIYVQVCRKAMKIRALHDVGYIVNWPAVLQEAMLVL